MDFAKSGIIATNNNNYYNFFFRKYNIVMAKPIKTTGISRLGSKQKDIKHFVQFLPVDVKTVIEPFGGLFAVIRNIYYEDKYKKIVCDNDPNWCKVLFDIKNNYDEFEKILDKLDLIKPTKELLAEMKKYNYSGLMESLCNRGSRKYINKELIKKLSEFIQKVDIYEKNGIEFIKEYLNDRDCFIFLDPPYYMNFNTTYSGLQYKDNEGNIQDNSAIIIDILEILKTAKAKVMLIINKCKLMEYFFKDYIKGEYNKQYSLTRNKNQHLIITNY